MSIYGKGGRRMPVLVLKARPLPSPSGSVAAHAPVLFPRDASKDETHRNKCLYSHHVLGSGGLHVPHLSSWPPSSPVSGHCPPAIRRGSCKSTVVS